MPYQDDIDLLHTVHTVHGVITFQNQGNNTGKLRTTIGCQSRWQKTERDKKMSVAKGALAGEAGRVVEGGINGSQNMEVMEQAYDMKINSDIESRLNIVQVSKSVITPYKAKKTYCPRLW